MCVCHNTFIDMLYMVLQKQNSSSSIGKLKESSMSKDLFRQFCLLYVVAIPTLQFVTSFKDFMHLGNICINNAKPLEVYKSWHISIYLCSTAVPKSPKQQHPYIFHKGGTTLIYNKNIILIFYK